MTHKNIFFFSFLSLGILLFAIPGSAQWTQVNQSSFPSVSKRPQCITFSNGILWLGIDDELWMSSDTGRLWKNIPFPVDPSNYIKRISFYDDSVGIVTSEFQPLYLTTNQGLSWKSLTLSEEGNAIFAGSAKKIIYAGYRGLFHSEDQGNSWTLSPNYAYEKVDVLFSFTGKVFSIDGSLLISNDTGKSWVSQLGRYNYYDSWSFDIDPCNNNIQYIANENLKIPQGTQSHILKTSDMGLTWKSVFDAPLPYLCGSISIARNAIYLQTVSDGIIRSVDQGQTWESIGGPSGLNDSRLVIALNENEVVAIDKDGSVWITYNSGGSPVFPNYLPFLQQAKFRKISSCLRDTAFAKFTAQGCGNTTITNVTIERKDSNYFSLTSLNFPIVLKSDSTISFPIDFDPQHNPRTFTSFLHIKGYFEDIHGREYLDTIIFINAISEEPSPILSAIPNSIFFDTISQCVAPLDSVVILRNTGCDTLTVLSGPGSIDPAYSVDPITLPLNLPPDSSILIHLHFKPTSQGRKFSTMSFHCIQRTPSNFEDVQIILDGNIIEEGGLLSYSPKVFNFKSLSICDHDSTSGFVTNIGCDSLGLDAAQIFGDPDYRVSGVGLRVSMAPADTIRYSVYLNPAQKGLRKGFLVLTSHENGNTRRDSIPFSTTVTDGTRILSIPTSPLDFGTQSLCDPQRDTLVTISNTGCDTLIITSADITGKGFTVSGVNFPDTILPNTSKLIHIFTLLDTAGGKLATTGTLTFTSNSDNTLAPITLSHNFIAGVRHDVGLFLDATAKAGGDLSTVTYDIKETPGKTFTGSGITKANFDLQYNTDLLEYSSSLSSPNLSSVGKSFTIANPQADANGVLATLGFRVYLTKDSTTTIILIPKNDTTILPCGIVTLSSGGAATFDYQFLCGERSISGFMNGIMPLKIISIRPNPAQDEIELDLESSGIQSATIEIFDALGVKFVSQEKNFSKGVNSIHLDTKSLSGGIYIIRIGDASQNFVKVK